ncbi:UNVERIFIED_CONTAM: hypothetical protein FKN15_073633 [Acipenser sinensis]
MSRYTGFTHLYKTDTVAIYLSTSKLVDIDTLRDILYTQDKTPLILYGDCHAARKGPHAARIAFTLSNPEQRWTGYRSQRT